MNIRFVNHNGDEVDLMNGSYKIEDSSLFSHSWDYDSDDALKVWGWSRTNKHMTTLWRSLMSM